MSRFKIVVADAKKAHDKQIERNVNANLPHLVALRRDEFAKHGRAYDDAADTFLRAQLEKHIREHIVGPEQPVGHVHDLADSECPDGMPNCRNCGDPAHAETCAAAGHCPHCGTRHGIAPDSVVAANGYRLEPV